MSKIIRKLTKPVLPFYAAGLVLLLCGLVLPMYRLWAIGLAAVLSTVAGLFVGRLCPERVEYIEQGFMTGSEDADEMLTAIENGVKQLQQLNGRIPDNDLSRSISRMEKAGSGILAEVEAHPEKAKQIRRFANYYLPDAVKILTAYAQMEQMGVKGSNSEKLRQQVTQNTADIAAAFENQLDALFAGDALDISTDIEVLQSIMKGQGLS